MKRVGYLPFVLVACGRLRIDAIDDAVNADGVPPCTMGIHDEDGDSIDDSCDVCPHIADPSQADLDGDRVGDACDPEPTLARQKLMLFDPFTSLDPMWTIAVDEHTVADELLLAAGDGNARYLYRPLIPAHDTFTIGASVGPGVGVHLITLALQPINPPGSFYCELYDTSAASSLQYTYTYDNTNYTVLPTPFAMRFANGSGTLTYEVTSTTVRCTTSWQAEMLEIGGARPAGIVPDALLMYADNIDLHVAYLVQIRTFD